MNSIRNPSVAARVCLVGLALSVPGAVGGILVGLFTGELILCALVGTALGAIGGGLIEAWPDSPRPASAEALKFVPQAVIYWGTTLPAISTPQGSANEEARI